MTKKIPLGRGKAALVNDADFDRLSRMAWHYRPSRPDSPTGYATTSIYLGGGRSNMKTATVDMHRVILDAQPGEYVDHKDGNGLNNVRSNLRKTNRSGNARNTRKMTGRSTSSRFKGVSWRPQAKKWRAYIFVGTQIALGYFDNEIDAALAYDQAALKYFGEFAHLNLP